MNEISLKEMKIKSNDRMLELLEYSLGAIVPLLKMDNVVEVMLNPDKTVWVDTLDKGMYKTNLEIDPIDSERTIHTIASHVDRIVDYKEPILSAELPGSGYRFQGNLPPISKYPSFTIRKKALMILTLDNYIENKNLTVKEKEIIQQAIINKQNILIVGGTSTGKTTFANAVLNEISILCPNDRIAILEDTSEIECNSKNKYEFKTSDFVHMKDLVKSSMRMRPDRIVIGEVRGEEALNVITAWNSGHPGGLCTIHSDSAIGGIQQLEQYIERVSINKQEKLIAKSVNIIIVLERIIINNRPIRRVKGIYKMNGYDNIKKEYKIENIS